MRVILKLFDNAKGYICIEDNKPDCIAKLKEMVKDIPRIEVAELMTKYPQGGERFLIKAVTDREINSAMLPADAGCVVDNVDTVIAVYEAVTAGGAGVPHRAQPPQARHHGGAHRAARRGAKDRQRRAGQRLRRAHHRGGYARDWRRVLEERQRMR